MPTFTIGQDVQVVINGPFGEIELPNGTRFQCDEDNTLISVKKLSGSRASRIVFDCWKGQLTFARGDDAADQLAQSIQNASLAGNPVPDASITYQINELDGTQTRYQLTKVTLDPKSLGDFRADESVMQTISFQAEQRQPA